MTDPATPEGRAELRRLLSEATPRPWIHDPDDWTLITDSTDRTSDECDICHVNDEKQEPGFRSSAIHNARLIPAAVNALPRLLDRIEELEKAQRWIPVEEALPEITSTEDDPGMTRIERSDDLLVISDEGWDVGHMQRTTELDRDETIVRPTQWLRRTLGCNYTDMSGVTHWQPLPPPPASGTGGGAPAT